MDGFETVRFVRDHRHMWSGQGFCWLDGWGVSVGFVFV